MASNSRTLVVQFLGDTAQLEAALGRAAGATRTFGDRMAATGRTMTAVGRTMTSAITLPVLAITGASVKMAVSFQRSMELIHTQAGVSQKAVDEMSKSVLKMAQSVGTTPETLSTGLFHLASQGLRGAKAMDALRIAAEGAQVGQANLEDVTNALGAVLVSGIKGAQNMTQAMGALNATVGAGDMHMQDLADAMGTGLPSKAAIFGVSLRDVGAALAVFGDNNIRGAQAGTLLNSTFRVMGAESKAAAKELATVGISQVQLANDMRSPGGLVSALEDLKKHMTDAGLTAAEQGVLLTRAFGGRQAGGVMILLDQLDRLKTKVRDVTAGSSGFGEAWAATTQTTAFKFDQLKAALASTAITIGNQLLPMVLSVMKTFEGWLQAFNKLSPSTKALIEKIALIAAAIGPVLLVGGKFLTFFSQLAGLLPLVATPMGALAAAVTAIGGAILAAEYAPKQFEAVLEKMGLSAKDAKKVVDDLRVAFDLIKTVVQAVWPVIKTMIVTTLNDISNTIKVFDDLLHGRWSKLWSDLKTMVAQSFVGMYNTAKAELTLMFNITSKLAEAIGQGILHHILDPLKNLAAELWSWLVREITSAIHKVVGWVKGAASSIGHAITSGIISGIGGLAGGVEGAIGGALHGALSLGGKALGWLGIGSPSRWTRDHIGRPIGQGIVQGAKDALAELAAAISGTMTAALNAGSASTSAGLRRLVNGAVQAVRSGAPAVEAAMRNLANGVLDAFDRQTQAGLDRIRSNMEKKLGQITQSMNAQLAKVAAATSKYEQQQMAPVNALAAEMQAQQRAHDLAAAQAAVAQAQQQLAADQGSGADAATIAADQQAVQEAQYQLQQLQEQYQLEDMKAAANKKITAEKKKQAEEDKKIRAEAAAKKQTVRDDARQERQQWEQRRKEERKQLVSYLDDLRSSLDGMAREWGKYGTKSGTVYADGLRKAEGEIRTEVAAINRLIREGLGMDIRVTVTGPAGGLPSHAAGGPTQAGLAVLHDGEYVLQRSAAQAIGRPTLDMLNRLPHFQTGGSVGGTDDSRFPSTPAMRASAMWTNDYGIDKSDKDIATDLIGARGRRRQIQAALRHTFVDGIELHHGTFRTAGMPASLASALGSAFPGLTFEQWSNDQMGYGSAVSRITGGFATILGLIQSSIGKHGKDSPLERLTSHAVHFDQGGIALANGLAMLHKNEAVIPLPKTGGVGGAVNFSPTIHVHGDLSNPTQRRQTARLLLDVMHSELARRSRHVNTLGLR